MFIEYINFLNLVLIFCVICLLSVCTIMKSKIDTMFSLDTLTGLYLLKTFKYKASLLISKRSEFFILLYININDFKFINTFYGSANGDAVLIKLASILKSISRKNEMLCRVSADHFAMLIYDENQENIYSRMKDIENALEGVKYFKHDFHVSLSCGIYLLEKDDDISIALERAHYAKIFGRGGYTNTYFWFDAHLLKQIKLEKEIEIAMESALETGEFIPYFQPKVDSFTGALIGAEALVRWNSQKWGVQPPSFFIDLFERNQFIIKLDLYIFEQVCKIIRDRLHSGCNVVPISCNFSRYHFNDTKFPSVIYEIANNYNIPMELLDIELTETISMQDKNNIISCVDMLKKYGFSVSIDDFGTAYSSLGILCYLEVDNIKIDRSLVVDLLYTQCNRNLVECIIEMARKMSVNVVCEGVDTEQQINWLQSIGCNIVQGYFYSKPVPVEEFNEKWLNYL